MGKKALISTIETDIQYISSWTTTDGVHEPVYTAIDNAQRVAQVEDEANIFDLDGTVMYWLDCSDNIKADDYYYNTLTSTITAMPASAAHPDDPV
jgi:hypothetical protein